MRVSIKVANPGWHIRVKKVKAPWNLEPYTQKRRKAYKLSKQGQFGKGAGVRNSVQVDGISHINHPQDPVV